MPEPSDNRKPLKVLEVLEATAGGARRHLLDLVLNLPAGRFEVSVACSTQRDPRFLDDIELLEARGIRVHELPMQRSIRPIGDAIAFGRLLLLIRRGGFDVVHTHSSKAGFLGRLAGALAGVPRVIHTPHAFPFEMDVNRLSRFWYRQLERLAARGCDRIVCVCPSQRALAESLVEPARVVVIENGIAPRPPWEATDRERRRREWGMAADAPVVGMVGRFMLQKGHSDFVAAAARVAARLPEARFVLVGDGELKPRIEKRIFAAGLKDRFLLIPAREDVPDLLPLFDVVALPSLWEGLPYVLLEAMAAGRGVVAARVGGMADVIENGVDGLLVPPRTPAALAEAIVKLFDNAERRSTMGEHARETVMSRYGLDRMIGRLTALYEGAL